jgi:hypothetical protein
MIVGIWITYLYSLTNIIVISEGSKSYKESVELPAFKGVGMGDNSIFGVFSNI